MADFSTSGTKGPRGGLDQTGFIASCPGQIAMMQPPMPHHRRQYR